MAGRTRKPLFEVKSSPIQGKGAFALRRIRPGTRIVEYVGERISQEEADERYGGVPEEGVPVLLFRVDDEILIDAGVGGNDARFINHSCDPNCETVTDEGHVYVEALRSIEPGEELTYDYGLEVEYPLEQEEVERYSCRCGAASCRGTMAAPQAE